jgi:5,10-methylenetetrahydromethanopterin reductase
MNSFGISLAASVREPMSRIADLVAAAEGHGFRIAYLLDSQVAFKDVYVTMALCALKTKSIRLAQGVTNPLTRDLTVTAAATGAIQEVSGGRAVLGLGNGGTAVESVGIKGADLATTESAIRKLRAMLAGEEVEHNGVPVNMHAVQGHVPIHLSGTRPKMLELASRAADGVILMASSQPALLREQLQTINNGLEKAGRKRKDFFIDLWQTISVDADQARALEDVKSWVANQVRYWFSRTDQLPAELARLIDRTRVNEIAETYVINEHLSLQAEHSGLVSPELANMMAIAGDADYCRNRLRELAQLDVDNITLSLLSRGREERLRTLADVIQAI